MSRSAFKRSHWSVWHSLWKSKAMYLSERVMLLVVCWSFEIKIQVGLETNSLQLPTEKLLTTSLVDEIDQHVSPIVPLAV